MAIRKPSVKSETKPALDIRPVSHAPAFDQEYDFAPTPAPVRTRARRRFWWSAFFLIVVVLAGSGYVYHRYTASPAYKQAQAAKENASLVKKVGKLMMLPPGTPAIFVIQDPTQLSGQQPFFAGAQKGDQLLVYSDSAKAIIYSPSRNIIVNVGPVTFDQPTKAPPPQKKPVPAPAR